MCIRGPADIAYFDFHIIYPCFCKIRYSGTASVSKGKEQNSKRSLNDCERLDTPSILGLISSTRTVRPEKKYG